MGAFGLEDWADVAAKRNWPVLLIGNGASRAVSTKFAYDSLYKVASLTSHDRDLFGALRTRNFEEVLNHLHTAELICDQVGHNANDVGDRYSSIRDALIRAVHAHHVSWLDVAAQDRLVKIRRALREHESVYTTNYDLLVYWAIMSAGSPPGDGFGDLFWNAAQTFDPFDTEPFGEKTLVYWLHGGLQLYREQSGETRKRTAGGTDLLSNFLSDGRIPLFVSEGTSRQKRRAIRRSDYLEHVYNAFSDTEENLVVFGQAFASSDDHLVAAVKRTPPRYIAYAVHATTRYKANLQKAQIENLFPDARVTCFDSETHALGDPALFVA